MICVSDQVLTVATAPPILSVLLPCGEPKPTPFTVTGVLIGPLLGDMEVTIGFGMVNRTSRLLEMPLFTVTLTGPVVAPEGTVPTICESLQLVVATVQPLIVRELPLPFVAWKPEPVTVICVPEIPVAGVMLTT